jgi:hypothetical protein
MIETVKKHTEDIDLLAEEVFMEALKLVGGLRSLIQYRNLTWLPSLAEAAYVTVLKNHSMLTNSEIAEKLGITANTVRNILSANEKEVDRYLKGEIGGTSEHIAGGIAKLAYRRVKEKREAKGG